MSGYQSDINVTQTIINDGDGGFAYTEGSADQYTITLATPVSSYEAGLSLQLMFHASNTGASTLNVDGLGAMSLKKVVDGVATDLTANDLNTLEVYDVVYNGLFFQIEVPSDPADIEQVRVGVNNKRFVTPYLLLTLLNTLEASSTARGLIELADQTEVDSGTDNKKAVTPLTLANLLSGLVASESFAGMAEIATSADALAGVDDAKIITSLKLASVLNGLVASESYKGLIEIATQTEMDTGTDDSKAVTPYKLASVLAGLSAGESGAGLIEVATQLEVDNGTDDSKAITPKKLDVYLSGLVASEQYQGLASIASDLEVSAGTDDSKIVTSKKLSSLLSGLVASESFKGLAEVATQMEVDAGTDDSKFVTPKKLAGLISNITASQSEVDAGTSSSVFVTPSTLSGYSDGGEPALGNPSEDGMILSSSSSGSRSWIEQSVFLHNDVGSAQEGANPGTGIVEITPSYTLAAGELSGNQGLRILISGEMAIAYTGTSASFKTLRIYIGDDVVLYNKEESSPYGPFQIEIIVHRFDGTTLVGWGRLNINGFNPEVQAIRTSLTNSIDSNSTVIKMTAQNPLGGSGYAGSLFTRYAFSVEKLVAPATPVGSTLITPTLPDNGNPGGDPIDPIDPGDPLIQDPI